MTDSATIDIGSKQIPIWPEGQPYRIRGEEVQIVRTDFADTADYHPGLIEYVLKKAAEPVNAKQYGRSMGGTKLYHLDQWDCPEAQLLNARALSFFYRALNTDKAAIDIAWVNIYRRGDYIVPHSHTRSLVSLVYVIDLGDGEEGSSYSGRFSFVDPRLPDCCLIEAGRMTNPLMPAMNPGTMLMFPSEVVHAVNPYDGERPRITASWNINLEAIPGSPLDAFREAGG